MTTNSRVAHGSNINLLLSTAAHERSKLKHQINGTAADSSYLVGRLQVWAALAKAARVVMLSNLDSTQQQRDAISDVTVRSGDADRGSVWAGRRAGEEGAFSFQESCKPHKIVSFHDHTVSWLMPVMAYH